MGCRVDVSDAGFDVVVAFDADVFDFELKCAAQGDDLRHPTDFEVEGVLNQEVLTFMHTRMPALLNRSKEEMDAKIGAAHQAIKDEEAKIAALQPDIDRLM